MADGWQMGGEAFPSLHGARQRGKVGVNETMKGEGNAFVLLPSRSLRRENGERLGRERREGGRVGTMEGRKGRLEKVREGH